MGSLLDPICDQCNSFHGPVERHDVSNCLTNKKGAAEILRSNVNASDCDKYAVALHSVVSIGKTKAESLVSPLTDVNFSEYEALFSISRCLCNRTKNPREHGNSIPGYWVRTLLGVTCPKDLDRYAFKLAKKVPTAGTLASLERLGDANVTAQLDTSDPNDPKVVFIFKINKDPQDNLCGLKDNIEARSKNLEYGTDRHGTTDAITTLLLAGFTLIDAPAIDNDVLTFSLSFDKLTYLP